MFITSLRLIILPQSDAFRFRTYKYAIDNKLFPNIALLKGATNKTMANFAFRMGFGLRIPHTYSTDDLEYLTKNNIVLNYQPNLNNNPDNPDNPDNPENNTKCDYVYIKGNFARKVLLGRCCLVKSPGNSNLKLNQLVALKDIEDYLRENKEDKDFNYINIAPENDYILHILAQTDDIRDFIEGLKKREFKDIKVVESLLERVIK